MLRATVIFGVILISATGCKKKEEPAPTPVPAAPAAPKTSPALPLMDKMAYEAAHRPDGGLSVEGFWSVLEKNGLKVTDQQQHVAGVFGARYCSGGVTQTVHVDLCEFDNDSDADASRQTADTAFAKVPNLKHFAHKAAMLSIRPDADNADTQATVKKVVELFNAQ